MKDELTVPDNRENEKMLDVKIKDALNRAEMIVSKSYLQHLGDMEIVPCPDSIKTTELYKTARFYKITSFVYEKHENIRDKLVNVFRAVGGCGGSLIFIIDSDGAKTELFIGAKTSRYDFDETLNKKDPSRYDPQTSAKVLQSLLAGNFPGTKLEEIKGNKAMSDRFESMFQNASHSMQPKSVWTITGIAALRSEEENSERTFVQGMEKLIDSMNSKKYTLLLIADPVSHDTLKSKRTEYEELYTAIKPLSEFSVARNISTGKGTNLTVGISDSINTSSSKSISHTKGSSHSTSHSSSTSTTGKKKTTTSFSDSVTHEANKSLTLGTSETDGKTVGQHTDKSENTSLQVGETRTVEIENKRLTNLLDKIENQIERIDQCSDLGMWACSVYSMADESQTARIVANTYQSLIRGEGSALEIGALTKWSDADVELLMPYLTKMHHPQLYLPAFSETQQNNTEETIILPASFISSGELAIHASLPQSSVNGLPVTSMASFGREVARLNVNNVKEEKTDAEKNIYLGSIYHMGISDNQLPVFLDKTEMTAHTFITGSTGSGKSTTVYRLLKEASEKNIPFLVIESAKGEYKTVFSDALVLGTNPKKTKMLRIDPFAFGGDIHVSEHIDRLIDIFNVCWPMEAAMPAVLKKSIEEAYRKAGWDLLRSENKNGVDKFPSIKQVIDEIKHVVDRSDYSPENKGNYKGALMMRLESISNGIAGMIFDSAKFSDFQRYSDEELFKNKVIVDLSRIDSLETKALIMGFLVMRLQEYYLSGASMVKDLRHITVLEEAHNLLKRTSTEQRSDSANLLGKSVEMLANSIAQMRTYGEGFIIADQSPGLLDMSVIRNTNTKIIHFLPDEEDRKLVGKAIGLNDDQITEIARLETGVAAVHQKGWISTVLCKVEEIDMPKDATFDPGTLPEIPSDRVCKTPVNKNDIINNSNAQDSYYEAVERMKLLTKNLWRKRNE